MQTIEINNDYKKNKKLERDKLKKQLQIEKNNEKKQLGAVKKEHRVKKDKQSNINTNKKKKKLISRGKLVKKLDSIFSKYIRLISADKLGICTCITCLEKMSWERIQNGHFVSRGNYKYRWDEKNCYPQCYVCNCIHSGNYKQYTLFMIRKHGEILVDSMINDKELIKISTSEIKEMIDKYGQIVKNLTKQIQDTRNKNKEM